MRSSDMREAARLAAEDTGRVVHTFTWRAIVSALVVVMSVIPAIATTVVLAQGGGTAWQIFGTDRSTFYTKVALWYCFLVALGVCVAALAVVTEFVWRAFIHLT